MEKFINDLKKELIGKEITLNELDNRLMELNYYSNANDDSFEYSIEDGNIYYIYNDEKGIFSDCDLYIEFYIINYSGDYGETIIYIRDIEIR